MNTPSFNTYLFSYRHAGAVWGFEIKASSPEDAKARVAKLVFATYEGELVTRIPVGPFPRWWARFVGAFR